MIGQADYIVTNANIITLASPNRPTAMAIMGDRILALGSCEEMEVFKGPDTKVMDLEGKTVLPGLNDNHCHPVTYADNLLKVDLSAVTSQAELLEKLQARAKTCAPGQWVLGYGYDEMRFPEKREPTLQQLDQAIPDHPLYVTRACLHAGFGNSRLFAQAGWNKDTQLPDGALAKDENGELTGRVNEGAKFALDKLVPPSSPEDAAKTLAQVCAQYNAFGVTSIADMGHGADDPALFRVWGDVLAQGKLTLRTASYLMDPAYLPYAQAGLPFPFGNNLYRVAGRKLFADGAIGTGTAGVSQPSSSGSKGLFHHSQEELDELVWEAHAKGIQISIHAMGDEGIRMALYAYQKAQQRLPQPDIRHRIEHCSLAYPDILDALCAQKVYPLFNSGLYWYFGQAHINHYGKERAEGQYPFRTALDRGLPVANGTDCPVTSPDPRPVLYAAAKRVTHSGAPFGPQENISVEEALRTYTIHGAFLTHEEREKGTLEPGKLADFIVVDRDPIAEGPEALLEMKVLKTVLGGTVVFA